MIRKMTQRDGDGTLKFNSKCTNPTLALFQKQKAPTRNAKPTHKPTPNNSPTKSNKTTSKRIKKRKKNTPKRKKKNTPKRKNSKNKKAKTNNNKSPTPNESESETDVYSTLKFVLSTNPWCFESEEQISFLH